MPRDFLQGYAFFDVDDTLISIKSMFSFQDYWYSVHGDEAGRSIFYEEMDRLRGLNTAWEVLNRRYYAYFAGRTVVAVDDCASRWFDHLARSTERLFHHPIVARLHRHRAQGEEVVFVSGSFPALLAPVARHLGVRHILATTMEVVDGRYTGEILLPQTIGQGKADAVNAFLAEAGFPSERCSAYGDDISDLPMLEAVGNPFVVAGGRGLAAHAATVGWPVFIAGLKRSGGRARPTKVVL